MGRQSGALVAATFAGAAWVLAGATALAKADFPAAISVHVPADRPNQIVVGTNFGLVVSEDGGATWTWSCEQDLNSYAASYAMAPAPFDRLFAVAARGLAFSDDAGCTWRAAGGDLAGQFVGAVQFEFALPGRVFVTATSPTDGGALSSILRSDDGGATFDSALGTVYAGTTAVTSFVIAPSDPMTMYLSTRGPASFQSAILKSTDGGASFVPVDLTGAPPPGAASVLAVDPRGKDRIAVRWQTLSETDAGLATVDDALVVADTGSGTWTKAVAVPDGALRALLILADGAWLVSAQQGRDVPLLFRSDGGGAAFAPVADPPFIVDLAERRGVVYAATGFDYTGATFALLEETSTDGGLTWQPGASFGGVQAISGCVASVCADACLSLSTNDGLWDAEVCTAAPPDGGGSGSGSGGAAGAGRGGSGGGAAGGAVGSGGGPEISGDGGVKALRGPSGCACATSDAGPGALAVISAAALAALVRRRRASGPRRRR
ncbi:MAG TPA: sialidase family protein [Polyangia bacterium]|jgi:uncharacterized protein (TIGR03382 family)